MARQERERRFISEYVLQAFAPGQWALNQPLGPVSEELVRMRGLAGAAALLRPQRRRVDAVAWDRDAYYVIEAKIRDPFEGLGRLIIYVEEARETPDLIGYEGQPIIPRLVVPYTIERDRSAARRHGIELVEYSPAWIADYVRERQDYFTAPHRAARDAKQRNRELLGLE
jgi:hypothetical protein